MYLTGLKADPRLGEVRLAAIATREGRSVDFDAVTSTIKRLEEVDRFGHASLHSGKDLVAPVAPGSFELRVTYSFDEKASLASVHAGNDGVVSLERNIFAPARGGESPLLVPTLPDAEPPNGEVDPLWFFLLSCEAWTAELSVCMPDKNYSEIRTFTGASGGSSFRVELDTSLEALAGLFVAAGSRYGGKIAVRELRINATGSAGKSASLPRLRASFVVEMLPGVPRYPHEKE